MGKHFLGRRQDGKLKYYSHCYNDGEYEALIERIGGVLPSGWVAWHFDNSETIANSKRIQALVERVGSVIGLYGCEPSRRWMEIELEDAAK